MWIKCRRANATGVLRQKTKTAAGQSLITSRDAVWRRLPHSAFHVACASTSRRHLSVSLCNDAEVNPFGNCGEAYPAIGAQLHVDERESSTGGRPPRCFTQSSCVALDQNTDSHGRGTLEASFPMPNSALRPRPSTRIRDA